MTADFAVAVARRARGKEIKTGQETGRYKMLLERASSKLDKNAHQSPRKVEAVANHDRSVQPEASLLGLVGSKNPMKASPLGLLV